MIIDPASRLIKALTKTSEKKEYQFGGKVMPPKGSYSYLTCPMCDVEIPLAGDEKVGEQVYCPYCQTPLALRKTKADELYLEEDF